MNLIIPMAGMGKRMRPHTLTTPKPLINIAGKSIVEHLVEDIAKVADEKIQNIAFVIGDFGKEVENDLIQTANKIGANGYIYYQTEALGTAHAILCAKELLSQKTIVAFADTLFKADFKLDSSQDSIIWVHQVQDPKAFGVVKINEQGYITEFIEKPPHFVSDLAIIGIYYFKDGEFLHRELQYLLDNNIQSKGEYQLTDALENMKQKGVRFMPGKVTEWLDCGNKDATVYTNQRMLSFLQDRGQKLLSDTIKNTNSLIIPPCFIAEDVELTNSIIGPYVSIGKGSKINNSVINNSILQQHVHIEAANIANSMIGNYAIITQQSLDLSLGDYSVFRN